METIKINKPYDKHEELETYRVPTPKFKSEIPSKSHPVRFRNDGLEVLISKQTSISDFDLSLTVQADKEACDINVILERFANTGMLTHENSAIPQYGDFVDVSDFHDSMNKVATATEMFMELPAQLRARFGNDPQAYVNFALDPANKEEAIRLGILNAPKETPSEEPPRGTSKEGGSTPPKSNKAPVKGSKPSQADIED